MRLVFIFILLQHCVYSQTNNAYKHPRSDGFYFYDNGLDTIVFLPEANEMQVQAIKLMQDQGLLSKHQKFTHEDSIARNNEGTTIIDCIAFFNDTGGTELGTLYRSDTFINYFIATINRRKAVATFNLNANMGSDDTKALINFDKTTLISDMHFINDSTFTFVIGRGVDYLAKKYSCIMRHDNLNVKELNYMDTTFVYYDHNYFFIPFNNIPSDLLRLKKVKK